MGIAIGAETPGTQSSQALNIIASNIDMAQENEGPICPGYRHADLCVHTPVGLSQIAVKQAIRNAVAEATKRGKLRPNSVDSLRGKIAATIWVRKTPVIHFEQWEKKRRSKMLILKGGGCENKNIQYSLPCELDTWAARIAISRCSQMPAPCGCGRRRARLRARSAGRLHRQRPRAWLRFGEGPIIPHAGRY